MSETGPDSNTSTSAHWEWRWVFVGAVIVVGLETLLTASFAAFGADPASMQVFLVATVLSFFTGGLLVGWLSPGWTIKEAGFASAFAVVWTGFLGMRLLDFEAGQLLFSLPAGALAGLLCGLAGGWVGEKIQHSG